MKRRSRTQNKNLIDIISNPPSGKISKTGDSQDNAIEKTANRIYCRHFDLSVIRDTQHAWYALSWSTFL